MDGKIRRAGDEDVGALLAFCRVAFPDAPKWQGADFVARRWWRAAMRSPIAEVWVVDQEVGPTGFVVVALDQGAWARARRDRYGSPLYRLFGLARRPRLLVRVLRARRERVRLAGAAARIGESAAADHAAERRAWLSLIAVAERERGSGLARRLMDHAEARALAAGCEGIALVVDYHNSRAQAFYRKLGYEEEGWRYRLPLFVKRLDADGNR